MCLENVKERMCWKSFYKLACAIVFNSLFWVFSPIVQAIISDHSKNNYSHFNNPFHMGMSPLSPQLKVKTTPAYQLMISKGNGPDLIC